MTHDETSFPAPCLIPSFSAAKNIFEKQMVEHHCANLDTNKIRTLRIPA
jgi:hypothetical protein